MHKKLVEAFPERQKGVLVLAVKGGSKKYCLSGPEYSSPQHKAPMKYTDSFGYITKNLVKFKACILLQGIAKRKGFALAMRCVFNLQKQSKSAHFKAFFFSFDLVRLRITASHDSFLLSQNVKSANSVIHQIIISIMFHLWLFSKSHESSISVAISLSP